VNRSRLLLAALSAIVVIISLWTTQANVVAQAPTKTPIGEPPTKPPLVEELPTKTPCRVTCPPRRQRRHKPRTLTPRATATATRTPTCGPVRQPRPRWSHDHPCRRDRRRYDSATAVAPASPAPSITLGASKPMSVQPPHRMPQRLTGAIGNSDPPAEAANPASPILTSALYIAASSSGCSSWPHHLVRTGSLGPFHHARDSHRLPRQPAPATRSGAPLPA